MKSDPKWILLFCVCCLLLSILSPTHSHPGNFLCGAFVSFSFCSSLCARAAFHREFSFASWVFYAGKLFALFMAYFRRFIMESQPRGPLSLQTQSYINESIGPGYLIVYSIESFSKISLSCQFLYVYFYFFHHLSVHFFGFCIFQLLCFWWKFCYLVQVFGYFGPLHFALRTSYFFTFYEQLSERWQKYLAKKCVPTLTEALAKKINIGLYYIGEWWMQPLKPN